MPPATTTTWPVTWPEISSEASATTRRATSSWPSSLAERHRPGRAVEHARVLECRAGHWGHRPPGTDRVDAPLRRHADDLVLEAEEKPRTIADFAAA